MSAGGGGFFNQFTPWGRGVVVLLGVPKAVALAGVSITLDSNKDQEENADGSPLRMRWSMISPTTTGIYTAGTNTPHVVLPTMQNTEPGGTQFFTRMAPLPRSMMPGDLCPHPALPGMGNNKARIYTQR